MYYRQKGQRIPTRSQAIHENFDLCAEALVQRLTSYKTQSEEYHNSCIQGERMEGNLPLLSFYIRVLCHYFAHLVRVWEPGIGFVTFYSETVSELFTT